VCTESTSLFVSSTGLGPMEPSDYSDVHISRVLHFIRNVGFIKGYSKGETQYIIESGGARTGLLWPTPYTFIHWFPYRSSLSLSTSISIYCRDQNCNWAQRALLFSILKTRWASHQIPRLLWNPTVHYCVYRKQSLIRLQSWSPRPYVKDFVTAVYVCVVNIY
jgi:hypothetical protein